MSGQKTAPVSTGGAPAPTSGDRWWARLSVLATAGAVVALLAGARGGLIVLVVGVVGLSLALAGGWWYLSNRGIVRWLAAGLVVVALVGVPVFYLVRGRLDDLLVVLLLAAVAGTSGRAAVRRSQPVSVMPEHATPRPVRPYVIMNPRSGGGKVGRFGLVAKAEGLGAEVGLLEGPGPVDVAALARQAVADGVDLLGVAGGDGTQALVAGIATESALPFLVISAGTRNHFAMDLGLDRERPDDGLEALSDGVEVRIDLGTIGGRTFVNNASFGAYADIVQSPAYRDDKRGTTLEMLPDILSGHRGPRLVVRVDGDTLIEAPQALLVSNNPYDTTDPAGLGRRARLDTGLLGVVAVTVSSAAQAVGLLSGRHAAGVRRLTAHEVVVDADVAEIPVGIDGESVLMPTPVHCTIEPLALRVRLPRHRPGVPVQTTPLDRVLRVWHLAVSRGGVVSGAQVLG